MCSSKRDLQRSDDTRLDTDTWDIAFYADTDWNLAVVEYETSDVKVELNELCELCDVCELHELHEERAVRAVRRLRALQRERPGHLQDQRAHRSRERVYSHF